MVAKFDRDAMHSYLFRHSDRHHRVVLDQRKFADEMGMSYYNFTVIMRQFAAEGRLRKIGGSVRGTKTFIVEDPAVWRRK